MPRLSKLLEKLEDRIANRCGRWYERNKARAPLYANAIKLVFRSMPYSEPWGGIFMGCCSTR